MKRRVAFLLVTGLAAVLGAPTLACTPASSSAGKRIEEAGFVTLGGSEQWVTIRGDDRDNPVLLHVHGGPGIGFSAFTAEFAPYEKDFTVVQWDQRGAGCTFGRRAAAPEELTIERIARDGVELAAHLRQRLGKNKIIVFGHSAGTIIATEMARRAPEHFAAYVGAGQFADFAEGVRVQFAYLRRIAETTGDAELRAALDAIGPLDAPRLEQFFALNRFLGARAPAEDKAFEQRLRSRAAEAMTAEERASWQAGQQASVRALMPQLAQTNLVATVTRLEIPLIVIQGADDLYTPMAPAVAYFEHVAAPAKELVIIDGAAHFPHIVHTERFVAELVRTTRRHAVD